MWTKPFGMREGFLIGGGLIFAGLILQLSVGPIDWNAFRWPVNGFVMAGFLTIIGIIYLLRKRVYGFQFIGTYKAAIPAMVYAVVLTIVMGLTRQKSLTPTPSPMGEGNLWINYMLNFWSYVLIYVYIAVILGQIILRRISHFQWKRDIPFLLNHIGLFLAMTTATLGNADVQQLKMITVKGETEWRALTQEQQIVELPFAIELKKFIMETYDDGSPKRFASDIQILTKTGKATGRRVSGNQRSLAERLRVGERSSGIGKSNENIQTTVEVNKPVEVDGWKIYQYGYDTQTGAMSQTSILELVSDPWLPLVYTGIYMMLGGAVCMFLKGKKVKK